MTSDLNSQSIQEAIDEALWSWIKPHCVRDAVIIVDPSLSLDQVGTELAADNKTVVADWIDKTLLSKPTLAQITEWDQTPNKKFLVVVIKPYVLMQVKK